MLKVELCIILIMMLIENRAVIQATNAANKDLYKFIFTTALLIKSKLVKTKEIFLNGQIRAGRTSKVKKQLILGLRKILIKNTKLQSDFVWVYLEDLLPDQMIEYGEILPKSGQEKKWFNSLSPSLRKRLKKMEKK